MNLLRTIQLPNGRTTSNLGFGCAGILRVPTSGLRRRLLHTALDCGITHFDTARSYGAGAAEGILGEMLGPHREAVTIGTKFGFPCGVPDRRTVLKQSLMRWALNLHPKVKQLLRPAPAAPPHGPRPHDYSVGELERSLATSLAQLRTDRIDLFFIHEPRAIDQVPENLGEGLTAVQKAGKIGAYGPSGYPADVLHFFRERPELGGQATQYFFSPGPVPDEVTLRQKRFNAVFHVVSSTLPQVADGLARDPSFGRTWSGKLSLDLTQRENLAAALLAIPLSAHPEGMTLFFTSKPDHLRALVRQLTDNSFTPELLAQFNQALSTWLVPQPH